MSDTITESTDDLLARHKQEISARLDELRPLLEEARRLELALEALEGRAVPKRRGRPPKNPQS